MRSGGWSVGVPLASRRKYAKARKAPRQLRIEYAGTFYHVMASGDRREAIVKDDEDRKTSEPIDLR